MVKFLCDRCGGEIDGTTYYYFSIYAGDINPKNYFSVSRTTAEQNVNGNIRQFFEKQKHYCKQCKDEIEQFILKKE